MSVKLQSSKNSVFLIRDEKHQITGPKFPSNRQVLAVLFYNIRKVNLAVNASANLTIRECIIDCCLVENQKKNVNRLFSGLDWTARIYPILTRNKMFSI